MRRKTTKTPAIADDEAIYAQRLTVAVGMSQLLRQMSGDIYLLPEYRAAVDSLLRAWDNILNSERPKVRVIGHDRISQRRAASSRRKRTA
jgi:hypothetical protein